MTPKKLLDVDIINSFQIGVTTLTTKTFKSTIVKFGARAFIPIPFNPDDVWGVKQLHRLIGTVNGCRVRGALQFDGLQFFLPLGPVWRRDNGIDIGAEVLVALSPEGPQLETLAPDVARALKDEPKAKAFFDELASFYRKNYIRWIESAKREETRAGRIREMIQLLKQEKKQK